MTQKPMKADNYEWDQPVRLAKMRMWSRFELLVSIFCELFSHELDSRRSPASGLVGWLVGSWQFFNYLPKKLLFGRCVLFALKWLFFCLSVFLRLPLVITAVNTVTHFTWFLPQQESSLRCCWSLLDWNSSNKVWWIAAVGENVFFFRRMNSRKKFFLVLKKCLKVFYFSSEKSSPGDVFFFFFFSVEKKVINVKLSVRMTGKN